MVGAPAPPARSPGVDGTRQVPHTARGAQVEEQVHQFIRQANRPFNVQLVADNLAKYGLKKAPVQKALEALAEAGKITCKEFGKTKIYFAVQSDFPVPDPKEIESKQARLKELTEAAGAADDRLKSLKREFKAAQESLTVEQLQERIADSEQQVGEAEAKLARLRSGTVLVSAEERAQVEQAFTQAMAHWAKRRRIFKDVWGAVSENLEGNLRELLEEMGVEEDGSSRDHASLSALLPKRRRV